MPSLSSHGIVIIANGPEDELRASVLEESLAKIGYAGPITKVCDSEGSGYASRSYKTRLPVISPYRDTLFLDADIIALRSFDELWENLNSGDLWMAPDLHRTVHDALADFSSRSTREERGATKAVCPPDQNFFNSGVILFRKTAQVAAFFETWHEEWQRYRQIDQFAAARAMARLGCFPGTLSSRYNYTAPNTGIVEGDITLLHCWRLPRKEYVANTKRFLSLLAPRIE